MSATKEVITGGIIITFFSILGGIVAYLTKLVLVRNLTVEEYGLFFSVLTLILFLTVFVSLGLPTGLARTIAKYRINNEFGKIKSIIIGSFSIQMIMSIILVIILFFLSDYLAINYFKNPDAKWLLIILSLYLPLLVIRSQFTALFNGFSKSFYLSLIQFLYNICIFLLVLIGFVYFSGIQVPMYAYLGSFFILFFILIIPFFKTFNLFKFQISEFKKTNKELIIFSLPLLFTTIGGVFLGYFDTLMLTHFSSLSEVGVYNIILPTSLLLVLIGSSLGLALLPVVTKLFEQGKKKYLSNAFSQIYLYVSFLILPAIISLFILSEELIRIFFGEEYLLGLLVFKILVLGSFFNIFVVIQNQTLIGIGKTSLVMWLYLIGSTINIILNLILIPIYSITGAGIATVISYFSMLLISYYLLNKEFKLNFPLIKIIFLILLSTIILFSVKLFWLLEYNIYFMTLLGLGVGWILYIVLVILFRIIRLKELFKMIGVDVGKIMEKIF